KIFLPEMNSGAGQARDVHAIVDEEESAVLPGGRADRVGGGEQVAVRRRLLAKLEAADADCEETARQLRRVRCGSAGVAGDRIHGRESEAHAAYAEAAKRSMKRVERRPSMKSVSSRMRRCSGMVVFTPSMTKKSRARRPRPMASSRSRPQTISLAIRES